MRGLTFRLGRVPVQVELTLFIIVALLGLGSGATPLELAVWVGIVFVSVLVHEMGHALAFLRFGHQPRVLLHGFGGLTSSEGGPLLSPGRNLVVSLAGPAAGLALGAAAFATERLLGPGTALAQRTLTQIVWVSVVWGAFNLLPVLPLDGGQSTVAFLDIVTRGRGLRPALVVSIVVGIAVTIAAVTYQFLFAALFMGMFTFRNIASLAGLSRAEREAPQRQLLGDALRAYEAGALDEAVIAARDVIATDASDPVRAAAAEVLVRSHLAADRPRDAAIALTWFPETVTPPRDVVFDVMGALHDSGEFQHAADVGAKAWARGERSANLAYNVASSFGAAGAADDALAWLRTAVEHGFRDGGFLDRDTDLIPFRDDPRYRELRARLP